MKYLLVGIIIICVSDELKAQPIELVPIENSLMKAIDWYIDSTTKYLNEISNENNKITTNGIVVIELICQNDTIQEVRNDQNKITQILYPRKFTFRMTMFSDILARNPLPSYYFIRGKTPVIIYSGLESFTKQSEAGLKKYTKNVLELAKGFRLISSIKAYLIEIDSNLDKYKAIEIPNTVSRYRAN